MRNVGALTAAAAAAALLILAGSGCSGSGNFHIDKARLGGIKKAAVVGFTVPQFVTSDDKDAQGMQTLIGVMEAGGKPNGEMIATDALDGFHSTIGAGKTYQVVAPADVAKSTPYSVLKVDANKGVILAKTASPASLANVVVPFRTTRNDYVMKAAKALGVDGVFAVDLPDLRYRLWSGIGGTGESKASTRAYVTLYTADGEIAWQDEVSISTEVSAPMTGGVVLPTNSKGLHTDIGRQIAAEMNERYAEYSPQYGAAKKQ